MGRFQAATPGLSRLAQSLAGGQNSYQGAYDNELGLQSKMAQALAAARASDANAEESMAKAAIERTKQGFLDRRPALVEELAASGAGTDVPMVQAIRKLIQTGQRPQVSMGPPAEDGSLGVGSQQFDPAIQSSVARQLQRLAPALLGAGDIKVDDWAKAQGAYREMDLGDDVLGGRRTAADVGRSQAAVAAKPLFNSDANGAVLELFGGGYDTSNPMAQGTIALKKEQAGAQKANAAQSYAAADNSRASAAETRSGTRGGGKAPVGYRWNVDGSLEPIKGGPADPATKGAKLSKPPTEGQAKALMFGSRMAVADEILGELAGAGTSQPGRIKQAVETIPGIGGALGMAVNSLPGGLGGPNDAQQQVEQAQRDFVNAVLRRESGAAIADSEFRNAQRQYFPQPGDSEAVKRQKAANRQTAIAGFKAEFGEQGLPEFEGIVNQARATRKTPSAPSKVARVSTDADFNALPSGATFIGPDGKTRRKP